MSALAEALVAAQAELPCALGKDADGQIGQRSYRYLTLDKLIAETRPILNKHGLTIVQLPTTIERGEERVPALRTELIFENTVLMLLETVGISAPAATATNPAINAYSIRSWPCLSLQILNVKIAFVSLFIASSFFVLGSLC